MWAYERGSNIRLQKLHNEEPSDLYRSPYEYQIKKGEMEVICGAREGEEKWLRNFDKKI